MNIIALLSFLFPLAYSPGPGNMFFAAIAARFGFRAIWPAIWGYHISAWLITCTIGFGFSKIMQIAPEIFTAISWLGVIYILYLAAKFWHAPSSRARDAKDIAGFWEGVWLMALNGKAYIIIALLFSQFLTSNSPSHVITLTTIFIANNFIAFVIWSAAGGIIHPLFADAQKAKWMNRALALMLASVSIYMGYSLLA